MEQSRAEEDYSEKTKKEFISVKDHSCSLNKFQKE